MQFHQKFPDLPVAVGEERMVAIPQLLQDRPQTDLIILDDAFQHRAVKAGLNILLTDYSNLFTRDFYLPTGDLRDLKSSYKRAQIIIVTKCKNGISETEKEKIKKEIRPLEGQQVFFTEFEYGDPYHFTSFQNAPLQSETEVLLVTGIANPRPLKMMLEEKHKTYQMLQFPDHHIFTIDDWKEIMRKFGDIKAKDKIILTTEKDAVRLDKFRQEAVGIPLYILPVRHKFLFNEAAVFEEAVIQFIQQFKQGA